MEQHSKLHSAHLGRWFRKAATCVATIESESATGETSGLTTLGRKTLPRGPAASPTPFLLYGFSLPSARVLAA